MVGFDLVQLVVVVIEEHQRPDQRKSTCNTSCHWNRSVSIMKRCEDKVSGLPLAVKLKVLSGLLKTLTSVEIRPMTEFRSAGLSIYEQLSKQVTAVLTVVLC